MASSRPMSYCASDFINCEYNTIQPSKVYIRTFTAEVLRVFVCCMLYLQVAPGATLSCWDPGSEVPGTRCHVVDAAEAAGEG